MISITLSQKKAPPLREGGGSWQPNSVSQPALQTAPHWRLAALPTRVYLADIHRLLAIVGGIPPTARGVVRDRNKHTSLAPRRYNPARPRASFAALRKRHIDSRPPAWVSMGYTSRDNGARTHSHSRPRPVLGLCRGANGQGHQRKKHSHQGNNASHSVSPHERGGKCVPKVHHSGLRGKRHVLQLHTKSYFKIKFKGVKGTYPGPN